MSSPLYAETSTAAPSTPPLVGAERADVIVVGGGYTGLSSALHLAETGRDVVLLEAHAPGWGAAGRNGGQVNPGLKYEPEQVEHQLGPEFGARLAKLGADGPDYVFGLIERHAIRCEAERAGTLRAALTAAQATALARVAERWRPRGVGMAMLDADETARRTGTHRYVAALLDPRGGAINPLAYARGLATAAQLAGARLHGASRARQAAPVSGGWRVTTDGGRVEAPVLIVATDGYTDELWPGLRRSVVPIYSAIVATEPLPARLATEVMPTRAVLYEVGAVTVYYRRDQAGRLLMGGRGVQRDAPALRDYRHLIRYAERLWPALRSASWTHWWNGQFALTPDFYPRLHAPAPGLFIALGYSGRGVALATILGRELARAATGTPLAQMPIPITPVRPIPLHRLWRLGVAARVFYGRVRDGLGV